MTKATVALDGKTYQKFTGLSLVQNSEGYNLVLTISNDAGTIVDLTAKTVTLEIDELASTTKKTMALTLSGTPTDGIATWSVDAADVDKAGVYGTEVTISDGASENVKFRLGLLTILAEII